MTTDNEPRALGAALSAPAFVTRGYSVAMHTANRHVERWAPEAEAGRVRSMRSLGFVDRLVAPWMETAQRSASMRLFSRQVGARGDDTGLLLDERLDFSGTGKIVRIGIGIDKNVAVKRVDLLRV